MHLIELISEPRDDVLESLVGSVDRPIKGSQQSKGHLDTVYRRAEQRVATLISTCEPSAWVRIAIEQLVKWTFIYRDPTDQEGLSFFAPVARYGWRYAADLAIRRAANPPRVFRGLPTVGQVEEVFTGLFAMYLAAESSNVLHFLFPNSTTVEIPQGDLIGRLTLKFRGDEGRLFRTQQKYVQRPFTPELSPEIHPDVLRGRYATILDTALISGAGFSVRQLRRILDAFVVISQPTMIVITHSFRYLAEWIADEARLPPKVVSEALNFMLLSTEQVGSRPRDYLRRVDGPRMTYFCGAKFPRPYHLDGIYSPDVRRDPSLSDPAHVVMSAPMMAEVIDNMSLLVHGSRPDLKERPWLRPALQKIETHYQGVVFETAVRKLFESATFRCISKITKSSDGSRLPCGEIDLLAFRPKTRSVFVIEAKALGGATSTRGVAQLMADFQAQKNYGSKTQKKIDWVRSHPQEIDRIFQDRFRVTLPRDRRTFGIFVTKHPHPARFETTGFKLWTYDDLKTRLRGDKPIT